MASSLRTVSSAPPEPALLSTEEGQLLVAAARNAIEQAVKNQKQKPVARPSPVFSLVRGLFVSLHSHPAHELRGCIGFPIADAPLSVLLPQAACAAARHDSRFKPLSSDELAHTVVEVSVLTLPHLVGGDAAMREKSVRVGRDGLIIEFGPRGGLLLPQVAIEWNFTSRQFLEAVCRKAALPSDAWRSASARLYTFSAQVFCEEKPGAPALEQKLICP